MFLSTARGEYSIVTDQENKAKTCMRTYRQGRLVARHSDGIDTRAEDVRFILDPAGGAIIFPLSSAMMSLEECVVYVPDESPDDNGDWLELQVELSADDEVDEELRDRHYAYHDRGRPGVWVRARVAACRFGSTIVDGAEIAPPNTLARIEPALCRACNADRAKLAAACFAHRRVHVSEATTVGVDNFGVDVRIALGVLRVEFDARVDDEASARQAIARLMETPV